MNDWKSTLKVIGFIAAGLIMLVSGLIGLLGTLCGLPHQSMVAVYLIIVVSAAIAVGLLVAIIRESNQRQRGKLQTKKKTP